MTPVIFLHHAAGSARDWDEILPRVLEVTDAVAMDLPAHGSGPGPALGSIEAMASFVAGTAGERGGGPFVLVGHSMGGAVALQMALDFAHVVAGLVLISTSARLRVASGLLDLVRERFHQFRQQMVAMGLSPSVDPCVISRWLLRPWPVTPGTAAADFVACDRFDVRDRLHEIAVPATVIGGDEDLMTPPERMRALAEGIAGARLRILRGTGHMAIWERPAEVAEEIVAMVRSVSGEAR